MALSPASPFSTHSSASSASVESAMLAAEGPPKLDKPGAGLDLLELLMARYVLP